MRALILVAGACLALSACAGTASISTAQKIDLGCQIAVLTAHTADEVAQIALERGHDPKKARKLADLTAKGVDVTGAICTVATSIAPAF
jgi:hypothetical protein